MTVLTRILRWFGRKGLLFLVIVAALLAFQFWQRGGSIIQTKLDQPHVHLSNSRAIESAARELEDAREQATGELNNAKEAAERQGLAALNSSLGTAKTERQTLVAGRRSDFEQARSLITLDTVGLLQDRKRELRIELQNRKIAGLEKTIEAAKTQISAQETAKRVARNRLKNLQGLDATKKTAWRKAEKRCQAATTKLTSFDESNWFQRNWSRLVQQRRSTLEESKQEACGEAAKARKAAENAQRALSRLRGAASIARASAWPLDELPTQTKDLWQKAEEERQKADQSLAAKGSRLWNEWHIGDLLKTAFYALLFIIISPFLIRLFCYFVLAPAAMRRPALRLSVPGGIGTKIVPSHGSTTSVSVDLGPSEELLVRQSYLQSSSQAASKGTQWFLDWRHPLTSFATGLTFLTRIRGAGQVTTVSAVSDPFAEVAIVELAEDVSCVLHPRALAAVAQPIGRPLRVTSHWRLGSLNAWLTMQLRYLVFHGPARLVVKGGRGVRVEQAKAGRIFGQDQLIGFSADLAYSVTRTETFWPYFIGREQLLKDRVQDGEGVLIVEEAPMAGRSAGQVRRGLEGLIDGGMKVFGL